MDEASSKFVDQLALEKMLGEKLSKVTHRPPHAEEALLVDAFPKFARPIEIKREDPQKSADHIILKSPVNNPFVENHRIPLRVYPADDERASILLIHGLFEDNRALYNFFIHELNRKGITVYMSTLPYHHERTPNSARFSGELFLSADLSRTKSAFIQAVIELRYCYEWIRRNRRTPLVVVGFSMGGTVTLGAVNVSENITGAVVVNPAANLSEVIWTSPLCETIKNDLMKGGWERDYITRFLATFDPYLQKAPTAAQQRTQFIYGQYDQITREDQYEALLEKWPHSSVIRYKAGHLNTLRVPRFAHDIARFCEEILERDTSTDNGRNH